MILAYGASASPGQSPLGFYAFWKFQFYNITRTEKSNQKIKTKYSSSKQSNTLATYDKIFNLLILYRESDSCPL